MIENNGRLKKSAAIIMSKMLQTFTLSYPGSEMKGPEILVIFTNFSAYSDNEDKSQNSP